MDALLRFRNHELFQRTAAICVVVLPALCGLLAILLDHPRMGFALAFAMVPVAALGVARGFEPSDVGRLFLSAGGAFLLIGGHGSLGLFGFGVLVGVAMLLGQPLRRVLWGLSIAGCSVITAAWAADRVLGAAEFASVGEPMRAALAGAAFGFISLFALAMRHLELGPTPIGREYQRAKQATTGEVQELVLRAYGVWKRAKDQTLVEEDALRVFRTATQWGVLDVDQDSHREAALASRMESLETRIREAADPVVKEEYERALEALVAQRKHFEEVGVQRSRVLARLHNYLATMEQLQLDAQTDATSPASSPQTA